MIKAIDNNEVAAFEAIYKSYRGKVYAYFLMKTNSKEDAKDLLQTVFLKLWQYRNSVSTNYTIEQQLFYIARTVFIDYLRKENKLQKVRASAMSKINTLRPEDPATEFDLHSFLQKKLSEMPSLRKRVFELNKIEGYSYKEIAEMLSIPVKSVDNNLTKALKFLRNKDLLITIILITALWRN